METLLSLNWSTNAVTWETDGRITDRGESFNAGEPCVAGDLNDPLEDVEPSLRDLITKVRGDVGWDLFPPEERAPLSSTLPGLKVAALPEGSGGTTDSGEDWLVDVTSSVRDVLSSMEL